MAKTSFVILESMHFPEQVKLLQEVFDAADKVSANTIWSLRYSKIDQTYHLRTDAAGIPISMVVTKQDKGGCTTNLFRFEHPTRTVDLMFPQWENTIDIEDQSSINACFSRLSNRFKMTQIDHLEMLRPGACLDDIPAGIFASLDSHSATRELINLAIEMQRKLARLPSRGIGRSNLSEADPFECASLILTDEDRGQAFRLNPNPLTTAPGLRWVKGKNILQSELPAALQELPSFWSARILKFGEDLLITMGSTWRFPINPAKDPIHSMSILPGFHRFAEEAKRICAQDER